VVIILEIRELLLRGGVLVIDPYSSTETPNEFLAKYGGYINEVALVAKHESGYALYKSSSAPTDAKQQDFYSTFSRIADDIGIKVYGVIHGMLDKYFGMDPKYSVEKSGGFRISDYVCPFKESYWRYLGSIAKEIVNFPTYGIVLRGIGYPSKDFCFCDQCRREFSEMTGIERDFSFEFILRDKELFDKWVEWRVENVNKAVETVVSMVRSVKPDLEVLVGAYFDPETNFIEGAREHFGQDVSKLADITSHILIHVMPWSPMLPDVGTNDYSNLLQKMLFTRNLNKADKKHSLFVWGLSEDSDWSMVSSLKKETNAEKIFVRTDYPEGYQEMRETRLGLS